MVDEKLFDALLNRLASREVVSLTFLLISSSASLILLGLIENINNLWWISVVGISFPLFALAYNEVTRFTIHKHDQEWIRRIVKEDKETKANSEKILPYSQYRLTRMILSRIMIVIPVIGWLTIIPLKFINEYENLVRCLGIAGVIITIILLSLKGRKIEKID